MKCFLMKLTLRQINPSYKSSKDFPSNEFILHEHTRLNKTTLPGCSKIWISPSNSRKNILWDTFPRTVLLCQFWLFFEYIFYSTSQWNSLENQNIRRIDFHKKWHNYFLHKQRNSNHSLSISILFPNVGFLFAFSTRNPWYWCSHFIGTILCCKLEQLVERSVSIREELLN